jgi:hypothetical protein
MLRVALERCIPGIFSLPNSTFNTPLLFSIEQAEQS